MYKKRFPNAENVKTRDDRGDLPGSSREKRGKIFLFLKWNKIKALKIFGEVKLYIIEP